MPHRCVIGERGSPLLDCMSRPAAVGNHGPDQNRPFLHKVFCAIDLIWDWHGSLSGLRTGRLLLADEAQATSNGAAAPQKEEAVFDPEFCNWLPRFVDDVQRFIADLESSAGHATSAPSSPSKQQQLQQASFNMTHLGPSVSHQPAVQSPHAGELQEATAKVAALTRCGVHAVLHTLRLPGVDRCRFPIAWGKVMQTTFKTIISGRDLTTPLGSILYSQNGRHEDMLFKNANVVGWPARVDLARTE